LSLALSVLVAGALWIPGGARAQGASSPDAALSADSSSTASAASPGASGASDAAAGDARAPSDDEVPPLQPSFGALKLGNYVAVLVSLLVGLAVYVRLRRGLRYSPKTKGYGAAMATMVVLFVILNWVTLSHDASSCASAVLSFGKDGTLYADTCRLAREGAANFTGLVSLYRQAFIAANSEYVIPLGPVAVRTLSFFSLFLSTSLLYLVFTPVALKLFVRN
jgi:hypothetical protein